MYAIVEAGGRQWKVEQGSQLDINRVPAEVGATHTVERVLLAHDGNQVQLGRPYLQGAKVVCEVLAHRLGPKTISYHFRRRENWRKTVGHRQPLTRLVVKDILCSGAVASGEPVGATVKTRASRSGAPRTTTTRKAGPKTGQRSPGTRGTSLL